MIRIVGLNPVVDKVYNIENFESGKKFKENIPDVYVGGKGGNVAKVINCLGEECVLYAFVGGSSGQVVIKEMESKGIGYRFVEISGETRTTVNIIDDAKGLETEITELGPKVKVNERDILIRGLIEDISEGDIVVCSGISIDGVEKGIYKYISEVCAKKDAKCIIDTNNETLKQSLPAEYYFAKPNIKELKEFFNIKEDLADEEVIRLCRKMQSMGIDNILLTLGEKGALLIGDDEVISFTPPSIEKGNTIGSGDSTVAGLCVGLVRNMSMVNGIKLALACGTSNATFNEIGFVTKESVACLYEKIRVSALNISE